MAEADPRVYDRHSIVSFRRTNERFGGLSNMAPGFPVTIMDTRIRTAEALYQACRFPHMPELQKAIISQNSPMTAKMITKPYRDRSRPDWNGVRIPIMKWCLRVKLACNWHSFSDLLLETGDLPIVEDSSKDSFWGAMPTEEGLLRGQNVLGRLLMELREKLKNDPEALQVISPVRIENFLLLERDIPSVSRVVDRHIHKPEEVSVPLPLPDKVQKDVHEEEAERGGEITAPSAPLVTQEARHSSDRQARIILVGAGALLAAVIFWFLAS